MASRDLAKARSLYEAIGNVCTQRGFNAYLPHKNTDPLNASEISPHDVFQRDCAQLLACSTVVAYLGEPSPGVGAQIAIAVQRGLRIFALHESGITVSRLILGLLEEYHNAAVYEYRDIGDGLSWLSEKLSDQ